MYRGITYSNYEAKKNSFALALDKICKLIFFSFYVLGQNRSDLSCKKQLIFSIFKEKKKKSKMEITIHREKKTNGRVSLPTVQINS